MFYVSLKSQAAAHFAVSDPKPATNNNLLSLLNSDSVKFNSKNAILFQQVEFYFSYEIYEFSVLLVKLGSLTQDKVKKYSFLI